jgi:D-3-phosphoglycerate dehydrogenase
MTTWRVLITDHPWGDCDLEREILEPAGVTVVDAPGSTEAALEPLAADADAIATCWAPVPGNLIEQARRCRHIARMGIGLDNIDLGVATSRGIIVTNVPDYCVSEVADHALALLLACARNVGFFHHRIKSGEYDLTAGPAMHRLRGRTLGLIGFGKIAREVRNRALGFGLEVQATSASGNDYGTGCRMTTLEDLLATSDFISLHAPLTPDTRHLLSQETLGRVKPQVVIVNTSRGGLIDADALVDALKENRVAGAGLDVFDPEPPDLSHPLFADERVITTPHAAFVSEEALKELRSRVCRQILAVRDGRTPESVVNPEVLKSPSR